MLRAKIGDIVIGTCFYPPPVGPVPSTGIIVSGNPMDLTSGAPAARMGDIVVWPCGTGTIITGTPTFLSAGLPCARLGDSVIGSNNNGTIIVGSPTDISK